MSRRILVVEDDLDNLRIATTVLVREGYEVVTARDAVTALAALAASPPALVLLDLDLPGVSGFETAGTCRSSRSPRSRIAPTPCGLAKPAATTSSRSRVVPRRYGSAFALFCG
jgi:CheY-like chemotaxis protein